MDDAQTKARFDWLVEIGGAGAPALAAAFAAFRLAPSAGLAPVTMMTVLAGAAFGLGWLAMRAIKPGPRTYALAAFTLDTIEPAETQEALLLDTVYEEPLLLTDVVEEGPLLLDDWLAGPDPDSRVVQLFPTPRLPTPGQLKERIDRHLATGNMHAVHEFEGPAADAADALYAALADLRRSLR